MGQQGFTLIEQIVTIAIMAMVLVAGIAALSTGALGLSVTVSRNQAMNLAQVQMECIKGAPFDGSASYAIFPGGVCADGPDGSGYATTTIVQGVVPDQYVSDPSIWDTSCSSSSSCPAQLILVTISRGGSSILDIEDIKVNRP